MGPDRLSELERRRQVIDAATIVGCLVAFALLWLFVVARDPWSVPEELFITMLQVIPATIVAVFVFAVGAIFVIAQIIGPTLGSRATELLLLRRRIRVCAIAGILILLADLLLTIGAGGTSNQDPSASFDLAWWAEMTGASLALASLCYIPVAILSIVSVLHMFVSPSAYSEMLSRKPKWPLSGLGRRLTSESAHIRLRALRQWLRTACRSGESRDIVFALLGLDELLDYYCEEARKPRGGKRDNEQLRARTPAEYDPGSRIVNSRWRFLLNQRGDGHVGSWRVGWFGDEFGRAIARSAEVGVWSNLLLRDMDRLLVQLGAATLKLAGWTEPDAGARPPDADPLPEEAGHLLDRIAEIGMYAYQVQGQAYDEWFTRSAVVLANLEAQLERVDKRLPDPPLSETDGGREEHGLASRALAAWCLVNYVLHRSKPDQSTTRHHLDLHGAELLGRGIRDDPQLWHEAMRLATNPAMHPSWLPNVRGHLGRQRDLDWHLAVVQRQVTQAVDRPPTRGEAGAVDGLPMA
jgi:hypothetical protein